MEFNHGQSIVTSVYLDKKSLHPRRRYRAAVSGAVCRGVIRNYLGPWIVARVRFWGVQQDVSLSLLHPRFFQEHRGSMVRGARILRVTRVAARLDCLQRLSNQEENSGKTNCFDQLARLSIVRHHPLQMYFIAHLHPH